VNKLTITLFMFTNWLYIALSALVEISAQFPTYRHRAS